MQLVSTHAGILSEGLLELLSQLFLLRVVQCDLDIRLVAREHEIGSELTITLTLKTVFEPLNTHHLRTDEVLCF